MVLLFINIVGVRFGQNNNQVNQSAYAEQSKREKIKDPRADFPLIKPVRSDSAKKQA